MVKFQKRSCGENDFFNIFADIIERSDGPEVEVFAVTARRIWLRRNGVLHGESLTHPNQLLCEVDVAIEDFKRATLTERQEKTEGPLKDTIRWHPPPTNSVKINWDAAVDRRTGRLGLGCVVRDAGGYS